MPMLDIHIPPDALTADVEEHLVARLTDLLITHEGNDFTNVEARSITRARAHRPASVLVGGEPTDRPRYSSCPNCRRGSTTTSAERITAARRTCVLIVSGWCRRS